MQLWDTAGNKEVPFCLQDAPSHACSVLSLVQLAFILPAAPCHCGHGVHCFGGGTIVF